MRVRSAGLGSGLRGTAADASAAASPRNLETHHLCKDLLRVPWCPRRSAGGSCPAPTLLVVAVMVVEFSPTLQTATHVFPWIAVIYCLIRPLALATTHVMAVVVAL